MSIDRFLKKHTLSNNKEYTPLIETLLKTQSLIFPANISRKIKHCFWFAKSTTYEETSLH